MRALRHRLVALALLALYALVVAAPGLAQTARVNGYLLVGPVADPTPGSQFVASAHYAEAVATAAQTAATSAAALRANNLSDLASASTARTNLGLGTAATHATTDYAPAAAYLGSNTTAALVAGVAGQVAGSTAWASNGYRQSDVGATGSGVPAFFDGSLWRASDSGLRLTSAFDPRYSLPEGPPAVWWDYASGIGGISGGTFTTWTDVIGSYVMTNRAAHLPLWGADGITQGGVGPLTVPTFAGSSAIVSTAVLPDLAYCVAVFAHIGATYNASYEGLFNSPSINRSPFTGTASTASMQGSMGAAVSANGAGSTPTDVTQRNVYEAVGDPTQTNGLAISGAGGLQVGDDRALSRYLFGYVYTLLGWPRPLSAWSRYRVRQYAVNRFGVVSN